MCEADNVLKSVHSIKIALTSLVDISDAFLHRLLFQTGSGEVYVTYI